jgi:hypothetical protein
MAAAVPHSVRRDVALLVAFTEWLPVMRLHFTNERPSRRGRQALSKIATRIRIPRALAE